jgi:glycosyltransferase involved in cell wall biosynthesis
VRNWLLGVALGDEDWVLWLDSDLWALPPTLARELMATGKQLVVPNCVVHGSDPPRTYDLNS